MKKTTLKILALLCCACMLLGLFAGCSKGEPAETIPASKPAETSVPAGKPAEPKSPAPEPGSASEEGESAGVFAPPELADAGGRSDRVYGRSEGATAAMIPEAVKKPSAGSDGGEYEPMGEADDSGAPPLVPREPMENASAFVLTAAEWNDNENWPFFTNLVNSGTISFPSFGIDPRNRIKVTLTDEAGSPLPGERVAIRDGDLVMWTAESDKNGVAYLFWSDDTQPTNIWVGGTVQPIPQQEIGGDEQNPGVMRPATELSFTASPSAPAKTDLQVMFIVDTTGSMSDELTYLQKDFASIAEEVGTDGVSYSVNFYRDEGDEYVTKCNPFSSDVDEVRSLINAEYATGGGDTPEAVAEILTETLVNEGGWRDGSEKLAFLIFDAPPHAGREQELQAAVQTAAKRGIRVVPVVASNAERETELFGRALAICTGGTYVFLTDDSGVGGSHLEPIVGDYEVELLHDLIVRIINRYKPS